ncbi:hypothetical protein ABZ570_28130 [Micromonospora sp. NPDC007271]|uniref:hypothetical protein n=1 Tax=Micromonospora sp. NPDC007271 TaxID=3154587 RepID=UPI0033F90AAA
MTVSPGCCVGLGEWRDRALALTGDSPWLGHDPSPEIEAGGDSLRVWQDAGSRHQRPGGYVDLPRVRLAALLADVQRDLVGFLACLDVWGRNGGLGPRTADLVAAVDRSFAIAAPLDLPSPAGRGEEPDRRT